MMKLRDSFEILKRYYSNKRNGKPLSISIEITQACNADCGFCGYRRSNNDGSRIVEVRDSYLDIILELNPIAVGYVGGEPLIRKDLEVLVDEAKREARVPYVQITTNGAFLTPQRYASLSAAGLDRVNISLDFLNETHDEARGLKGLYGKIAEFLEEVKDREGARIGLNTVVLKENLHEVPEIVEFAYRRGIQVTLIPYNPNKIKSNEHQADSQDVPLGFLTELKQKYPRVIINTTQSFPGMEEFLQTGHTGECDAGHSFLWVLPNGRLRACIDHKESEVDTLEEVRGFKDSNDCDSCYMACRGISETVANANLGEIIMIGRELGSNL